MKIWNLFFQTASNLATGFSKSQKDRQTNGKYVAWAAQQITDSYQVNQSNSYDFEPRSEETGLRGFRPGPTQTRLYCHRRWLEA